MIGGCDIERNSADVCINEHVGLRACCIVVRQTQIGAGGHKFGEVDASVLDFES